MMHNMSLSVSTQSAPPGTPSRSPWRAATWVLSLSGRKQPSSHPQQWNVPAARIPKCLAAYAARSDSAVFRHPGELDLNLREYMVVLEKPVGLTLAPDPITGQVVVQDIKPRSPAAKCGLIQVGDVVKSCSAVFGDEMWPAADLRRVRWAINSRLGDVKLVLERCRRPEGQPTAWYCGGKAGVVTRERDGMQLPYTFNGSSGPEDTGTFVDLPGAGRVLQLAFHRNTITQPPPNRRASAAVVARAAAVQRLRRELAEARAMPRLDLSYSVHQRPGGSDSFMMPPPAAAGLTTKAGAAAASGANTSAPPQPRPPAAGGGLPPPPPPVVDVVAPPPPSSSSVSTGNGNNGNSNNGNGASSGNGGGGLGGMGGLLSGLKLGSSNNTPSGTAAATATAGAGAEAAKERRVVAFLPWLLVSCGRLEHRHIVSIASQRSLGALLELSLTRAQPPPAPPSSSAAAAAAAAAPAEATAAAAARTETGPAAGPAAGPTASGTSSNTTSANGSSSSNSNSSSSGTAGGGSNKAGGYLVVRGSDLLPLASDIGRVSYQALLAAATAAANPAGAGVGAGSASAVGAAAPPPSPSPSPPPAQLPPPPPPGSAAATAALINGADVVAADGSSLVATSLTGGPSGSSGASSNGSGSAAADGSSTNAGEPSGNGGGLGSSTMAFLNRSIFLNLRPSMAFAAAAAAAMSAGASPAPSSSASPASGAAGRPTFSSLPTSRYDTLRVRHLLNAAASLQRLSFRRGGKMHRARRDACSVLLHCDDGMEADVAVLLAGWLHWYGRLPLQEAILAAETAMGHTVDQGLLEAGTAALLQGARERCSRVVLTWKYGGLSAYVAGDVVASWSARVPMVRCRSPLGCKGDTHPGHFFLEIQGLRPGVYYYKYIVDGTWAVDSFSSKVLDSAGNWNNVLVVPEPPVVLTSREGLALARWQALRLALEAKLGLNGPTGRPL